MSLKKSKIKILIIFTLIVSEIYTQQTDDSCPGKSKCPSGECTDNLQLCSTFISCQSKYQKCNQYICSTSLYKCTITPCSKVYCWNGQCVDKSTDCPSISSCPLTDENYTTKCHDRSCIMNKEDCPNLYDCPLFLPVKCPTGECRKNIDDCPSLMRCPDNFSVMCNDGSCTTNADYCIVPSSLTQCSDQNTVRCTSGNCVTSSFLCPTPITCSRGYVLCWDNICAISYNNCNPPKAAISSTCNNQNLIRCLDGSCKESISLCPTMMICPINTPVRCWDNSCKETIDNCPKWQDCPLKDKQCSDGTCLPLSSQICGTQITCTPDAPYKCYDNTCKKDPLDCPKIPNCPWKSPILCWDGKCVSNRVDCTPIDYCNAPTVVKCPDGSCKVTLDECKSIIGCPNGFLQCDDGSCRKQYVDCPIDLCPINLPFKCSNGMCVSKSQFCDKENGCPFYAPFKCKDGSCNKDDNCVIPPIESGKQNCDDGSTIGVTSTCLLANGCPINNKRLCADMTCIDPLKQSCPIPNCNPETPVMCSNGLCVISSSNCPSIDSSLTSEDKTMFMCADGRFVKYGEKCKPLNNCANGFSRCPDGSCRVDITICPNANTCPNKMMRCDNGSCSSEIKTCLNTQGCPNSYPIKCPLNGLCVVSINDCQNLDSQFPASNGCDLINKYKCSENGACVNTDPDIKNSNNTDICVTPVCEPGMFLCYNNGKCINEKDKRSKTDGCSKWGFSCPIVTPYQCADKSCKLNALECINQIGCAFKNNTRGIDGNCYKYPNLISFSYNDKSTSPVRIQCPDYKPFICIDGSCVQKREFCSVFKCPDDKKEICPDRTCRSDKNLCSNIICPSKNPILCRNGNCVNTIYDCADNFCPNDLPIRCASYECTNSRLDCILYKNTTYLNTTSNLSNCDRDEAVCGDGSCRPKISMCPIYEGCNDPNNPYKCKDGSCGKNNSTCVKNITIFFDNQTNITNNTIPYMICSNNQTLCEDGICRSECPKYNGCPNDKPLMCPNGFCVNEISECAGMAGNCGIDTPFRCIDGTCKKEIMNCPRPKRTHVGSDYLIYVYPTESLDKEIILDDKNNIIGSLNIPAFSFIQANMTETYQTPLIVRSVPSQILSNTFATFDITRRYDLYREFPNVDLDNKQILQYQYAVLSAVINITLLNSNYSYNHPLILSLVYDFPVYIPDISNLDYSVFDPFDDVCLGILNMSNNLWNCVKEGVSNATKYNNYLLKGEIFSDGIYAVIFQPSPETSNVGTEPNFLVIYLKYILIASAIASIVLMIGFYVFWRVYRYRDKYKDTKKKEKKFEVQMTELTKLGTSHLGQTLGDNMSHIFYTDNPSFKVIKSESKSIRENELENMKELLSKRLRVLESNNESLKTNQLNLISEINRLKEYYSQ